VGDGIFQALVRERKFFACADCAGGLLGAMKKSFLDFDLLDGVKNGFTVKELAEKFGTSENSVNSWMSRQKKIKGTKIVRVRTDDRFIFSRKRKVK